MMYENYEINENTLLIIPVSDEISKIYELNETFFISKSVKHIIDHSCKYFGSSYSGRYEGTKHLIGMNYKLPIIIEETKDEEKIEWLKEVTLYILSDVLKST